MNDRILRFASGFAGLMARPCWVVTVTEGTRFRRKRRRVVFVFTIGRNIKREDALLSKRSTLHLASLNPKPQNYELPGACRVVQDLSINCAEALETIPDIPKQGSLESVRNPHTGLWFAGYEGMEQKMENTIMAYIGTTMKVHSFSISKGTLP